MNLQSSPVMSALILQKWKLRHHQATCQWPSPGTEQECSSKCSLGCEVNKLVFIF